MENASKALLIAGAILIVILLIAVGMLVYSKARSVIDTGIGQMSSTEISMFNSAFNDYEGSQKGTSVRVLLEKVISNNETYSADTAKQVKVNDKTKTDDIASYKSTIKPSTTYTVEFGYTSSLITSITIKDSTSAEKK